MVGLSATPVYKSSMKGWRWSRWCVLALCCCLMKSCGAAAKPAPEITSFLTAKRAHVERVAKVSNAKLPAEITQLFDTAAQGNWRAVSNLFKKIEKKYGPNVD